MLCARWPFTKVGSLEEAVHWAEIAAILTCNWDEHVRLAEPFITAGKTVYIDKPIACKERDLWRLLEWKSAKLVLGSSNRYAPELLRWRKCPDIRWLLSSVGQSDPFGYGIHAVEMGQAILGIGARRVRALSSGPPFLFEVEHTSGTNWQIATQKTAPTFQVLLETSSETCFLPIAGGKFHGLLVDEVFRVHEGNSPLFGVDEMVEAIRILKAAHASVEAGNGWISLEKLLVSFSGEDYQRAYLSKHSLWKPSQIFEKQSA
ncbi:hypothetical protein BH09VER1_BH09VER1_26910 [soil metagenome]